MIRFTSLFYFDGKESAVYVRVFREKEPDEGCAFEMTDRYRKHVWNVGMMPPTDAVLLSSFFPLPAYSEFMYFCRLV